MHRRGRFAQQKTFYKLGSFPPGTTPFIVNTAWANAVNKYVPGVEIQISATGAATQHVLLVTEGKMDFFMGASSSYWLMYKQIGPYKKLTDGPARTHKMAMIFSYPLGVYHFVVYAELRHQVARGHQGQEGVPRSARRRRDPQHRTADRGDDRLQAGQATIPR